MLQAAIPRAQQNLNIRGKALHADSAAKRRKRRVDGAGGGELALEEREVGGGEGGGGEEAGVDHADERAGGEALGGATEAGEGDVGFVLAGFAGDAKGLTGGFDLVEERRDGGEVFGDVDGEDARGALAGEHEEVFECEGHLGDVKGAEGGDEERDAVVGDVAYEFEGDVEVLEWGEGGDFFEGGVGPEGLEKVREVLAGGCGKFYGGEKAHWICGIPSAEADPTGVIWGVD